MGEDTEKKITLKDLFDETVLVSMPKGMGDVLEKALEHHLTTIGDVPIDKITYNPTLLITLCYLANWRYDAMERLNLENAKAHDKLVRACGTYEDNLNKAAATHREAIGELESKHKREIDGLHDELQRIRDAASRFTVPSPPGAKMTNKEIRAENRRLRDDLWGMIVAILPPTTEPPKPDKRPVLGPTFAKGKSDGATAPPPYLGPPFGESVGG